MSSFNIVSDLFWEAAKGKLPFSPVTFPVKTINPPTNTWVVAGPLGSGSSGTLYPYNIAPSAVTISSSSASDTALGTGARTLVLIGKGATTGVQQSETITLNGTTPVVSTLTDYLDVFPFQSIATVGSNGSPVGDISFTISGILAHKIRAGYNRDVSAGGVLPSDLESYFFEIDVLADKPAELRFQVRSSLPDDPFIDHDQVILTSNEIGGFDFLRSPIRIQSGFAVQQLVRARFPNTTILTRASATFISKNLL
ncbi:MAG: hypothetical protein L0Y56_01960 [Nitrospira sp.]|nr:hypothetical protein [Nitrospira sp.]